MQDQIAALQAQLAAQQQENTRLQRQVSQQSMDQQQQPMQQQPQVPAVEENKDSEPAVIKFNDTIVIENLMPQRDNETLQAEINQASISPITSVEIQMKDTPKDVCNAFIELLLTQDYEANGHGVTHFKMSDWREAQEWVDKDHLFQLAGRIARGITHLEVTNMNKMFDDGRWSVMENFMKTIINNATQLLHLDFHNFSGEEEDI